MLIVQLGLAKTLFASRNALSAVHCCASYLKMSLSSKKNGTTAASSHSLAAEKHMVAVPMSSSSALMFSRCRIRNRDP